MNEVVVARWETRGKDWLELRKNQQGRYFYSGKGCGGSLPILPNDESAADYMEKHAVAVLKSDRPSLKRVIFVQEQPMKKIILTDEISIIVGENGGCAIEGTLKDQSLCPNHPYNAAMDGIESLILAMASNGSIFSPVSNFGPVVSSKIKSAIDDAVNACEVHLA